MFIKRKNNVYGAYSELEHNLLTDEVMFKLDTLEIHRPPKGQKLGGKWQHWWLPSYEQWTAHDSWGQLVVLKGLA